MNQKDIPVIDRNRPQNTKTATFGMGCFWTPDARFGAQRGVIKTRVGYAGGTKPDPTYHSLGDHTETVQIEYDPEQTSYNELLQIFWENHNVHIRPYSTQYKSIIFYHDDNQKELSIESKDLLAKQSRVYTEIIPFRNFYLAEFYHQKYILQGDRRLTANFVQLYGKTRDFIDSTATARVNGYLAGFGENMQFKKESSMLGLTTENIKRLADLYDRQKYVYK